MEGEDFINENGILHRRTTIFMTIVLCGCSATTAVLVPVRGRRSKRGKGHNNRQRFLRGFAHACRLRPTGIVRREHPTMTFCAVNTILLIALTAFDRLGLFSRRIEMKTHRFGKTSQKRLVGVDTRLVRVVYNALKNESMATFW